MIVGSVPDVRVRADPAFALDQRLYVGNPQNVVWHGQYVAVIEQLRGVLDQRVCPGDRVGFAVSHMIFQVQKIGGRLLSEDIRDPFQGLDIAAFAAEGELVRCHERIEQPYRTGGEILRRRKTVLHRKLYHKISSGLHRKPCTPELVHDCNIATLYEAPGHYRNDMRCAVLPRLFDVIEMPVVEGVVLTDYTADFHFTTSFHKFQWISENFHFLYIYFLYFSSKLFLLMKNNSDIRQKSS